MINKESLRSRCTAKNAQSSKGDHRDGVTGRLTSTVGEGLADVDFFDPPIGSKEEEWTLLDMPGREV